MTVPPVPAPPTNMSTFNDGRPDIEGVEMTAYPVVYYVLRGY